MSPIKYKTRTKAKTAIAPLPTMCQHPTNRREGRCDRQAIGEFAIPEDYDPGRRHAGTPEVPRPRAFLCRQHKAKVEAHGAETTINAGSHEAQCAFCQHPDRARVEALWIGWVLSTGDAVRELRVSYSTFYKHVAHFDLWARKTEKVNTKRALVLAAERGFAQGGHSARTALLALQLLAKERGDADNLNVRVGRADLSALSDDELAAEAEKLARRLKAGRQ